MSKLKWEWILNESSVGVPTLLRSKVEGGWLVATMSGENTSSLTYINDKTHKWDVEVSPGTIVTIPPNVANQPFDLNNDGPQIDIPTDLIPDLIRAISNLANKVSKSDKGN